MRDVRYFNAWLQCQANNLQYLTEYLRISRHPYGFFIVRPQWLLEAGYEARIHVWRPAPRIRQNPDWPIHSHNSSMISIVLSGALTNKIWLNPQLGFGDPIYVVEYNGDRSVLLKSSVQVCVNNSLNEVVCAGESYVVDRGIFHDTSVETNTTCVTLCFFERPPTGVSLVVGNAQGPNQLEFDRQTLSGDDESAVGEIAISALSRALQRGQ